MLPDLPYDFSRIGEAGLFATVRRRRITAGFDHVKAVTGYMPESSAASKFRDDSLLTRRTWHSSHGSAFAVDRVVVRQDGKILDRGQRNFRVLILSAALTRCKQCDTIVKNIRDTEQHDRR